MERGIQRIEGDDEWGTAEISGNAPGENAGPKTRSAGKGRKTPLANVVLVVTIIRRRVGKPPSLGTNLCQSAQRNCRASLTNASARAQGRLRSFPAKRVLGPA